MSRTYSKVEPMYTRDALLSPIMTHMSEASPEHVCIMHVEKCGAAALLMTIDLCVIDINSVYRVQ